MRKMALVACGLWLLATTSLSGYSAEAGLPAQCEELLTRAQQSGEFGVQVLRTEINGRARTVVLLGEQHWDNSSEAGALGLQIAGQFPFKIAERARLSTLWGGFYFEINKYRAMKASLRKGYSISTVRAVRKQKDCFDLEEGYTWTLRQQLASLALPVADGILKAGDAICLTGFAYLGFSAFFAHDQLLWAAGSVAGTYVGAVGLMLLTPALLDEVAVGRRDQAMAANIDRTLSEHDEIDQLLVIAGNAHLPALKLLLEEKGYQSSHSPFAK